MTINALKSRTVWTVIIGFALSMLQTTHSFFPTELYILIESILTALAIYFRTFPKQV